MGVAIERADLFEQELSDVERRRVAVIRNRAFLAESIDAVLDAVRDTGAQLTGSERAAQTRRVAAERARCDQQDIRTLRATRAAIMCALVRLDGLEDSHELSRQAPARLREACGFTRVMISRAHGTRWFPDIIGVADGADPTAAEFARFARAENAIPLGSGLAETRMLRRREAVLVRDAGADPRTYKPLVRVTRSPGYVAAPIVADDHVIGFLHADRADQPSPVTLEDRESVALFACEFGVIFESAVLRERLRDTRLALRRELDELALALDDLAREDPLLATTMATRSAPATGSEAPPPRRDALLSRREREVLELIVRGATNEAVAQELTISAQTVKTHVSSILRKLRVSSRAGAVARYLQLRDSTGGPASGR